MRIQRLSIFLLVFAFCTTSLSTFAVAQYKEVPPFYEEFDLVNLLGFPSIREHLKEEHGLSEKVIPELKELGSVRLKNMHRRNDLRKKSRKMSDEKFAKARTQLLESIQKVNQENWSKAKKLLTKDQIARLGQLRLQRIGVAALVDAQVIDELNINESQIKSAMELQQTYDQKILALKEKQLLAFKGKRISPNSKEMIAQNKANAKEREEAKIAYSQEVYDAVLDDQQKLMFSDLRGEPFTFKLDFDFSKIKVQWHTNPLQRTDEK